MSKTKTKIDYLAQLEKDMVLVEKGSFMMGSDEYKETQPVLKVTFEKDFYICKYPVTQGLWKAVMGEDNNPSHFKGDNRPVEQVSWDDIIQEFLPKLNAKTNGNYRLPSEAEWEYSARGGKNGNHNLEFAGSNFLKEVGWFENNSPMTTKPVGLKKGNKLGLKDMSGNVWEWCQDVWKLDYNNVLNGKKVIDTELKDRRSLRGGAWGSHDIDCCVFVRFDHYIISRFYYYGFRLVMD